MKTRILLSLIFLPGIVFNLAGQNFASHSGGKLILDNGAIKRTIQINNDRNGIVSNSMMLSNGTEEFLSAGSDEFSFEADGRRITGRDKWKLISVEMIKEETGGSGAVVILDHPAEKIRISITYILYPRLPLIRKRISFENRGSNDIKLEALDVERILFRYSGTGTDCWVMNDYARQKSLGQFTGNWYDPVVVVHEVRHHRGIVLGNEAPGVMKRTTAFLKPDLLTSGLTHPDQNFGFREWLKPGVVWESPWVFTGLYENSDEPYEVLNSAVSDYVRRHMGTRLSKIHKKPVFVYNTWAPFTHKIDEKLIYELADAAAECGIGAYTTDKTRSGCHAKDHPMHKDRNESMLEMYRRTWQLFDDLHKEAPDLFIDCTFETMGDIQLIDLDMCKHAEGNWLSNFYERAPLGSMRVRQMSWWRTPVIPATALVIGNQQFDDPEFELSLMSLAGSLPIVLGDPRLLSGEERTRMKKWADWLKSMQDKHDFMSFRQDLYGYGEPAEGNWDGYQRVNSESHSGGIVGIFRQGSPENQRTVTVQFLNPSYVYEVRKAPSGELVANSTGKELAVTGFKVVLEKKYDGSLFEIARKNDK